MNEQEVSADNVLLYRLTIIAAVGLIILYVLAGHCIEKAKVSFMTSLTLAQCLVIHESTVGVLMGVFV